MIKNIIEIAEKNNKELSKNIIRMYKKELQEGLKPNPKANFIKLYTKEYINCILWEYVPFKLIRKYKKLICWSDVSAFYKLSEAFIKKHKTLLNWRGISMYQHLSETFIEKYKDFVNWDLISKFQQLSEPFIEKYKDLVNWKFISRYQKLSETFIETHWNLNISLVNGNWLNKDTEFKKKAVIDTGLYECHEDYFIAYKGIRANRYSAFNFQYRYLPGNTYTCFADGSKDENSFGLSVWDKANARDYCPELIIKCKVFYEDVSRVVHDGGKIRCSKITILD